MHQCCKGKDSCVKGCIDSFDKIETLIGEPKVVCHHQDETCRLQFLYLGHIKYCKCPIHEQMLLPLERSENNGSRSSNRLSSDRNISS